MSSAIITKHARVIVCYFNQSLNYSSKVTKFKAQRRIGGQMKIENNVLGILKITIYSILISREILNRWAG